MNDIKTWQDRLGPDYLYSPLEQRILKANAEIAELRAALTRAEKDNGLLQVVIEQQKARIANAEDYIAEMEAKDKEIEQAAKLSCDWTLDYAAMHFDGVTEGISPDYLQQSLKDAPMNITPIMEALEKAKGQK